MTRISSYVHRAVSRSENKAHKNVCMHTHTAQRAGVYHNNYIYSPSHIWIIQAKKKFFFYSQYQWSDWLILHSPRLFYFYNVWFCFASLKGYHFQGTHRGCMHSFLWLVLYMEHAEDSRWTPWGPWPSRRNSKPLTLVWPSKRQQSPQAHNDMPHREETRSQLHIPETGIFKYTEDINSNLRAITETKPQRLCWQPLILKPIIWGRYRL